MMGWKIEASVMYNAIVYFCSSWYALNAKIVNPVIVKVSKILAIVVGKFKIPINSKMADMILIRL